MRRTGWTILVAAISVLLAACTASIPPETDSGVTDTEGSMQQIDELFVPDPVDPGKCEFQTNDPAYWGPYGFTLWNLSGRIQQPFVSREVVLYKVSGDAAAGYGIIFCMRDTADAQTGETMLVAMINTKREFVIGEVTGTTFAEIVPWTGSEYLIAGYSQENTMAVSYSTTETEYILRLNGAEAARFRDDEEPRHDQGGASGYIVVISPLDSFPGSPVHVIFEED